MANPPVAPILLIAFNRPDLTRIVLSRIREQRPAQLWVAVDGPRDDVGTDETLVEAVRAICDEEIDWRCDVKRRYHATNQGCLMAVSGAISWFLDDAGAGIIIEDDCLPHPTFFPYAATLLRKYEHDPAVMHIGGTNALAPVRRPWSYYFSRYTRIWGWATWRRAWRHFDATLSFWPDVKAAGAHRPHLPIEDERILWEARWDSIYEGRRDTWDDSWFLCRLLHGRAVVPTVNLVSNLGFREDAVHTKDASSDRAARACQPMAFPLTHPSSREPDEELDRLFYEACVRPWVPARPHATDPPS
jgi:hypothetical protein